MTEWFREAGVTIGGLIVGIGYIALAVWPVVAIAAVIYYIKKK